MSIKEIGTAKIDQLIKLITKHPQYIDAHSGEIREITTLGFYESVTENFAFPFSRNVPYMSVNPLIESSSAKSIESPQFVLSTRSVMVLNQQAMKQLNESGIYQNNSVTIRLLNMNTQ
jgi:hypothetical protein